MSERKGNIFPNGTKPSNFSTGRVFPFLSTSLRFRWGRRKQRPRGLFCHPACGSRSRNVPRHCQTWIGYPAVSRCRKSSASSSSSRWRCAASSSAVPSDLSSTASAPKAFEAVIERVVYGCRFMTLLGVSGSLVGSLLCFIKGCTYVAQSFAEYTVNRGKVILLLVEAIDVYLLRTVMLVFGMGLYELFVCNLDIAKTLSEGGDRRTSNLFGIFTLKERTKWLEIKSVDELKAKLGHVIVMVLLIGLFDKSKKAAIRTPVDLLCFLAAVLLSSGCLYLLSKLNGSG